MTFYNDLILIIGRSIFRFRGVGVPWRVRYPIFHGNRRRSVVTKPSLTCCLHIDRLRAQRALLDHRSVLEMGNLPFEYLRDKCEGRSPTTVLMIGFGWIFHLKFLSIYYWCSEKKEIRRDYGFGLQGQYEGPRFSGKGGSSSGKGGSSGKGSSASDHSWPLSIYLPRCDWRTLADLFNSLSSKNEYGKSRSTEEFGEAFWQVVLACLVRKEGEFSFDRHLFCTRSSAIPQNYEKYRSWCERQAEGNMSDIRRTRNCPAPWVNSQKLTNTDITNIHRMWFNK